MLTKFGRIEKIEWVIQETTHRFRKKVKLKQKYKDGWERYFQKNWKGEIRAQNQAWGASKFNDVTNWIVETKQRREQENVWNFKTKKFQGNWKLEK